MSNIVKNYRVVQKEAKSFIIDSNELVSEKVKQYEMMRQEEDGFQEAVFQQIYVEQDSGEVDALTADIGESKAVDMQAVESSKAEIQAMMDEANQEIERNREQAMAEVEAMKARAFEEAKQSGHQAGYQEGYTEAEAAYAQKNQELKMLERDLSQKYEQKISELEPYLVKKITGIYEKVFQLNLSEFEGIVAKVILNIVQNNDGNKNYFVHLSKEDLESVSGQKEQIMSQLSASCQLELVLDTTLSKGDCFIETDSGIYDCGVTTQLEELNRLLQVISYQ